MANDIDESGQRMYAPIAGGTPFHGYDAKFAARQLLLAYWKQDEWYTGLDIESVKGAFAEKADLLTKSDIKRIGQEAWSFRDA